MVVDLVNKKQLPAQKGQAAIELVLSLLLFVMMLGTLMSLSLYLYISHTFLAASKEGARVAAVDSRFLNAGTQAAATANVRTWVKNFVQSSCNMALADSDIQVTPPAGVVGQRTVTVTVAKQFDNPIQIRTFMDKLSNTSNSGSSTNLDRFTISNTATLRYEE
jgi:hypothetical protein